MKLKAALAIGLGVGSIAVATVTLSSRTPLLPGVVLKDGSSMLPNGVRIRPADGVNVALPGDLPLAMLRSANGKRCYVVTGGFHNHGISVLSTGDQVSEIFLPTTKCAGGIVETGEGTGYITAGDLGLRAFQVSIDKDAIRPVELKLPERAWLQGLAALPDGTLVATDINNDQLIWIDPIARTIKASVKVGHKPNRVAVDGVRGRIAVTNQGAASISLMDLAGKQVETIAVGIHPSELAFGPDGTLYVSNAGSNTVSVIRDGAVVATVFTSLTPNDVVGSTPCGLALSPDGRHLFVANAGSNNVAQLDVSDPARAKVEGFVPSGWYPTAVSVTADGGQLIVGTGKGIRTAGNYPGDAPSQTISDDGKTRYDYLPDRLDGDARFVPMPDAALLREWSETCVRNANREMSAAALAQETAMIPTLRKIKHVIYIIRENRTYDQVLGDLKGTNAEPKLCMYGEKYTPNGHKIARTFKTFDNLYCDGEVSQDGHQWCCASYCTDFNEKIWPTGYAGRGTPDDDESVVSSPSGYLWDNCRKHGKTYRSYGEFASFSSDKGSAPKFNGDAGLDGHASLEWSQSEGRDKDRVDIFINDMKKAEGTGAWPNFMVMSLGEDHTSGRRPGAFTPFANVASNDLGLGKLVSAVSRSKFWSETAIFVIQDDAQDGPDHVDGHRTVGYVISPYIKRGGVDHTMYSTASMVRTMELILGLPPMTQHDRHATSMVASFTTQPNLAPFTHEPARIDLEARNPNSGPLAEASKQLDLSTYDVANPDLFNRILWADAKPGVPYPTISHLSR